MIMTASNTPNSIFFFIFNDLWVTMMTSRIAAWRCTFVASRSDALVNYAAAIKHQRRGGIVAHYLCCVEFDNPVHSQQYPIWSAKVVQTECNRTRSDCWGAAHFCNSLQNYRKSCRPKKDLLENLVWIWQWYRSWPKTPLRGNSNQPKAALSVLMRSINACYDISIALLTILMLVRA